jgi:Caspase domain
MSAIVYSKKVNGPATHAIVIGVGHYPHLPGGGKKQFANSAGMGQLKSPPQSARAIARWVIESYNHPDKPLASLSLLVADSKDPKFTYGAKGKEKTVQVSGASMAEVEPAIMEWRELGDKNPDHLLLFFFCGHGIAVPPDLSLLLSDFGEKPVAPLNGAIDFRRFRQNMDECAAREQCYFVDACRVGSELLIKNSGFTGMPIIQSVGSLNTTGKLRQAPVFYSTLSGAQAYAKSGEPSLYTQALLDAFAGAGSDSPDNQTWRVETSQLHRALGFLVSDASELLKVPQTQISPADELVAISLNVVDKPQVPVIVSCKPKESNRDATLICESAAIKMKRKPKEDAWRLRLPVDIYDFTAKIKTKVFTNQKFPIRPIFNRINLDINQ